MRKLIYSYCITSGVVYFVDGTSALFTPEAAAMVEKIIYLLSNHKNNFQETEALNETQVTIAVNDVNNCP